MVDRDSIGIGPRRRGQYQAAKHLAVYLNDHLAGSVAGLELVGYLEAGERDARIREIAATLRRDIAADRHALETLMHELGIDENAQRQATMWLVEKLAELKARWDDPTDGGFRLLQIAEALALGVEGKEALWLALAALPDSDLPLNVDLARLVERARDQRRRVELIRVMAARAAFGVASGGLGIRRSRPPRALRHTKGSDRLPMMLALAHGAYFAATGAWPLVHMRSFETVTGPKVDKWLVRTVGVLVSVIGASLITAGARRTVTRETITLAVGAALGLAAIDMRSASTGRIAPIYLVDAVIEGSLAGAWMRLR